MTDKELIRQKEITEQEIDYITAEIAMLEPFKHEEDFAKVISNLENKRRILIENLSRIENFV